MVNNSNKGTGRGRNQGNRAPNRPGPEGICTCPQCGKEVSHKRGVPCYEVKCPDCGAQMIRK